MPGSGRAAEGIEAQTEQALRNLSAVLDAAGASLAACPVAPANVGPPRGRLLVSIDAIALLPT